MNQSPDNYEDSRQNGGAVAWLALSIAMLFFICFLWCALHQFFHNQSGSLTAVPVVEGNR